MTRRIAMCCVAGVLLAGCGGDERLDVSKPESVAREYYATFYRCAPGDPGLRYDLSTSPERDWSRATYVQRDKCQPTAVPDVDARLIADQLDQAVVVLTGQHIENSLVLVRVDNGRWLVDTSRSQIPVRQ